MILQLKEGKNPYSCCQLLKLVILGVFIPWGTRHLNLNKSTCVLTSGDKIESVCGSYCMKAALETVRD